MNTAQKILQKNIACLMVLTGILITLAGCTPNTPPASTSESTSKPTSTSTSSLSDARANFETQIISTRNDGSPPEQPPGKFFSLVEYTSPVGKLPAYVTKNPGDGKKHPAIVWIVGGDINSIGDVWSPNPRSNDQSAAGFRQAGVVMMFPSLRGGNNNPGKREGFFGEADDILAATDYLASLPYVDNTQIYLGGHSTGGTMAMLMAALTDRYNAVFALGPVARAKDYGRRFNYYDLNNAKEARLRAPIEWLDSVTKPLYVFEGEHDGNWYDAEEMKRRNNNANISFYKIPGHNHFDIIAPLTEIFGQQIIKGEINITPTLINNL